MYYKEDEISLDLGDDNFPNLAEEKYNQGYLFGRISPGYMSKTRSLRIDINQFYLNSENRRVLKKFAQDNINLEATELPISKEGYSWKVHKLGKEFYSKRFEDAEFSASKIREIITTPFSFNRLFIFNNKYKAFEEIKVKLETATGFAICFSTDQILHYAFPFYDLDSSLVNNLGMYMMLQAIIWAQMHGLSYCYLGGVTRQADKYKLQFKGLQWHDGDTWRDDIDKLKSILKNIS
jgi:arginyl-tRNA--protein-N-Asp/Glu arginylyltransferase